MKHRMRAQLFRAAAAMLCFMLLHTAEAQWARGTPKFNEEFAFRTEAQESNIRNHPYLVHVHNPAKFQIDTDTYE